MKTWWQRRPSRRDFLRGVGVAAGAGSLAWIGCNGNGNGGPGTDAGAGDDGGPTTPPPSSTGVVRHDVMSSEGQAMLDAYRTAVAAMRNLPESDPTSWAAQANVHVDWCPHGNAYFLPWHRGYLHFFEQIIRRYSNDPAFALPYWDWTTHPSLPDAFWQGTLNDPTRRIQQGQAIPPQYVGPAVMQQIMALTDFQTFASAYVTSACSPSSDGKEQRARCASGRLEATPHNNVHTEVGGRTQPPPVGNMSTFLSPLDPIFWLHHCNVDRLWAEWIAKGNQQGSDTTWRNFTFQDNFVNAQGQPQSIQVQATFDTAALGYRYDTVPADGTEAAAAPTTAEVLAETEAAVTGTATLGEALRIPVDIPADLREHLQAMSLETSANRTVRLTVGGIDHPESATPVHVYVGGTEAPSGGESAPGYLGTVSFFPIGEGSHHGTHAFLFDVSDKVGDLAEGPLHVYVESSPVEGTTEAAPLTAITPKTVKIEVVEQR